MIVFVRESSFNGRTIRVRWNRQDEYGDFQPLYIPNGRIHKYIYIQYIYIYICVHIPRLIDGSMQSISNISTPKKEAETSETRMVVRWRFPLWVPRVKAFLWGEVAIQFLGDTPSSIILQIWNMNDREWNISPQMVLILPFLDIFTSIFPIIIIQL